MVNKHFFKPLLHGFNTHLTIPVAFFLKYIEGRSELKMVKLRSDVSESIWEVKLEDNGQKLTDGWEEFTLAHDLRIGDILIFRQEIDMTFHVTILGPSCCEIQYESCLDDRDNNLKKNSTGREKSSLLDHSCFVANVAPSSLRYDTLDNSWNLCLKRNNSRGTVYITRGWRKFCRANGLRAGGSYTFKLIQSRGTLVLRLSEEEEEEESAEDDELNSLSAGQETDVEKRLKRKYIWEASSSASQNRFVTLKLTSHNLRKSLLYLPVRFTRFHGINDETRMSMLDKHGTNWSTQPRSEKNCDRIRLARGWKEFFKANCVEKGESAVLELIWERDTSCVLKFRSKVKQEI